MKIHEYQAKELFKRFGIPVPKGGVAESSWEAYDVARPLAVDSFVVKAQIHAGGRGKGGGVKIVHSPDEVSQAVDSMLGIRLVTPQTGPEGKLVMKVLVEEAVAISSEIYLAVILDRSQRKPVLMASRSGGMDIEEVAAKTPEKIVLEALDPMLGISAFNARKVAFGLELGSELVRPFTKIAMNLFRLFSELDCSLVEINPLVLTESGDFVALDAKINFDDNGLYRHANIKALRDFHEEEPLEILASRHNIDYVKLDGEIGCMVNGAGLAMATMDIIKECGSMPANFLDIKGGAKTENVVNAFKILMSDQNVKAVLINIFGGIVKCDMVAQGIDEAMNHVDVSVPVVIRLEGTNAAEGTQMLAQSGYPFIIANGLKDAADKVVALLQKASGGS